MKVFKAIWQWMRTVATMYRSPLFLIAVFVCGFFVVRALVQIAILIGGAA